MTSIRFLFTVMPKVENREKWIIRAVCECLGRFRYPEREQLGPEVLTWAAEGAELNASALRALPRVTAFKAASVSKKVDVAE